jgi:hypothetical protein
MPHGRVIWKYGRYTPPNHQNARLPAWVISRLICPAKVQGSLLNFFELRNLTFITHVVLVAVSRDGVEPSGGDSCCPHNPKSQVPY